MNYSNKRRKKEYISAINFCNISKIKELLKDESFNPNLHLNFKDHWYMWNYSIKHQKLFEYLISDDRIDMNIFCSKNFTPLIWAVVRNLNNIVKILLKSKKVDPNITDPNGLSLIDLALVHKNNEILEMLLSDESVIRREPNLIDHKKIYHQVLKKVKRKRNNIFCGLMKIIVWINRMQIYYAEKAYSPDNNIVMNKLEERFNNNKNINKN